MLDLSEYFIVKEEDLPPSGQPEPINLVLKGGGSLFVSYLGAYEAILERNIPIRHIMGTSAGAFFAFYVATKLPPSDIKSLLFAQPGPIGAFK